MVGGKCVPLCGLRRRPHTPARPRQLVSRRHQTLPADLLLALLSLCQKCQLPLPLPSPPSEGTVRQSDSTSETITIYRYILCFFCCNGSKVSGRGEVGCLIHLTRAQLTNHFLRVVRRVASFFSADTGTDPNTDTTNRADPPGRRCPIPRLRPYPRARG